MKEQVQDEVNRRFSRDHAQFAAKLNEMVDASDLLVAHLNAVLLTRQVPVDIGNYPRMVTSGDWSDGRIKIKNTGDSTDMVLALIFEGFNALSDDAYQRLDKQFDMGRMTLRQYGRQKATIEANAGYPRLLVQIRASNPDLALGDDAQRAVSRWQSFDEDESRFNAWFVESPHGDEGRGRLISADLYAYERVMGLNKTQMARTINLLVNGPPGPDRSSPEGWQTFVTRAQGLWENLHEDCQEGRSKGPAAFLHIGNTARNQWPAKNVNLINFGFSAAMMTQAYKENAGFAFPVLVQARG